MGIEFVYCEYDPAKRINQFDLKGCKRIFNIEVRNFVLDPLTSNPGVGGVDVPIPTQTITSFDQSADNVSPNTEPLATTRGRSRSASALIPQRSWRRSRGTPRRTLSSATSSATHASASNRGPPWCASLRPICRGRLRHPVSALPAQPALPVGLCAGRHGVI
jgi:hypothetical protein